MVRISYCNSKTKNITKYIYHKITVSCDSRQEPSAVRETDFKILKHKVYRWSNLHDCGADGIKRSVGEEKRLEVGGGADRKTRWKLRRT